MHHLLSGASGVPFGAGGADEDMKQSVQHQHEVFCVEFQGKVHLSPDHVTAAGREDYW